MGPTLKLSPSGARRSFTLETSLENGQNLSVNDRLLSVEATQVDILNQQPDLSKLLFYGFRV